MRGRGLAHVLHLFYPVSVNASDDILPASPGHRIARGIARLLRSLDHAVLPEFVPAPGLRVDLISLSASGEIWIVECKSSRADLLSDRKWHGYLEWGDRYFWGVEPGFPRDLLPADGGLIVADSYGGEIAHMPPPARLAGARRNRLIRDIARVAALRLQTVSDPQGVSGGVCG